MSWYKRNDSRDGGDGRENNRRQRGTSLGDGGFRADYRVLGLTNPDSQDMLIVVPSPAVIGLAGLGLVGLRRRRR